jgi:prepilin-type N-terminal cleavage/methylation domain
MGGGVAVVYLSSIRGFSLIEVMISWLLLSLGLLGLLAFETKSLQDARASLYQSLAQTLLNDAHALIQLNDNAAMNTLQTEVTQLLPQGHLQGTSVGNLVIQWRLPETKNIQQLRDHAS